MDFIPNKRIKYSDIAHFHPSPSPSDLSPTQIITANELLLLLSEFKCIVLKGENGSGKHTLLQAVFSNYNIVNFDIFSLISILNSAGGKLTNQHLYEYLNTLSDEACKIENKTSIIYIRNLNYILDVLADCYAPLRFLFPLAIKTWIDGLPDKLRVVMSSTGCVLPENSYWLLEHKTTNKDMQYIISKYLACNNLPPHLQHDILNVSKTIPISRLIRCLRYAKVKSVDQVNFIQNYKIGLNRYAGSTVDVEKDVKKPEAAVDLVGLDYITDALQTSIITPMELNIPNIPIKKGILLCGPPGTGKTSIGRWLAHKIGGKFYLIGGEAGVSGTAFIDNFDITMTKAKNNSPAVVFVDDCDTLFNHEDTYRLFLTILDGIDSNRREDVCVILTCMNLKTIPSSLLRGGRLEQVLYTQHPNLDTRIRILTSLLEKSCVSLSYYNQLLCDEFTASISDKFIKDIAHKMEGWNCADIQRCVLDITREIISSQRKMEERFNIRKLFLNSIGIIREQYTLCGRCDSTDINATMSHVYS